MNHPGLVDIVEAIDSGHFDEKLDLLSEAIHQRRVQLRVYAAHRAFVSLSAGDKVQLMDIRPKYLSGATATVLEMVAGDKIRVRLDRRYGRYSGDVTCPASSVRHWTEE